MSSLLGPGIVFLFVLFFAALIFLYIMSILWARKDALARGANEKFAMIISLIPFAGVLGYVLMRPPLLLIDKEEQELDIALKRRQINKYGTCPNCDEPVESHYLVCPNCQVKLKEACSKCNYPLEPQWNACPNCSTPVNKIIENASYQKTDKKEFNGNIGSSKNDYLIEESFLFDDDVAKEADFEPNEKSKHIHHFNSGPKTEINK